MDHGPHTTDRSRRSRRGRRLARRRGDLTRALSQHAGVHGFRGTPARVRVRVGWVSGFGGSETETIETGSADPIADLPEAVERRRGVAEDEEISPLAPISNRVLPPDRLFDGRHHPEHVAAGDDEVAAVPGSALGRRRRQRERRATSGEGDDAALSAANQGRSSSRRRRVAPAVGLRRTRTAAPDQRNRPRSTRKSSLQRSLSRPSRSVRRDQALSGDRTTHFRRSSRWPEPHRVRLPAPRSD